MIKSVNKLYFKNHVTLAADVGGMLGLFLGASVFTIIDFVRYALSYLYKEYRSHFRSENKRKLKDNSSSHIRNVDGLGWTSRNETVPLSSEISGIDQGNEKIDNHSKEPSKSKNSSPERHSIAAEIGKNGYVAVSDHDHNSNVLKLI